MWVRKELATACCACAPKNYATQGQRKGSWKSHEGVLWEQSRENITYKGAQEKDEA